MSPVSGSTEPLPGSCLVSADSRQDTRESQVLLAPGIQLRGADGSAIEHGEPVIDI